MEKRQELNEKEKERIFKKLHDELYKKSPYAKLFENKIKPPQK